VDAAEAAPKLQIAGLVRAKNRMRRENADAEVDKNRRVRHDGLHNRLPSSEFNGCLTVRASEGSHGCGLAVMAGSHS
jgi:hypothetical protein